MDSYMKQTVITLALCFLVTLGESCFCTQNYDPVCASNMVTFSNLCQFQCAQSSQPELTVMFTGICPGIDSDVSEFDQPAPEFEEEETERCACAMDYNPICGSNGATYGNLCQFNCARKSDPSLSVASYGECDYTQRKQNIAGNPKPLAFGSDLPKCFCTREYRPVCASSGKTYPNICEFKCAQKANPELSIVLSSGPCTEE